MKRTNYPAFHKRLAFQRCKREKTSDGKKTEPVLAKAAHISQVALVMLAAFGYFYTVKPVYQKERLAEEVAKSQSILENQRKELQENTIRLEKIQEERNSMAAALEDLRKDLVRSERERREIEEAIAYMTYEYYLPDGSPAKTSAEVQTAIFHNNLRSFASNLKFSCGMNVFSQKRTMIFPAVRDYGIGKIDEAWPEYFPYTREEIEMWNEHGRQLPNHLAASCARQYAEEFLSDERLSNYPSSAKLRISIEDVVSKVESSPGNKWEEIEEPKDVMNFCRMKRNEIEVAYKEGLEAVEDEYKGRENVWGESRREILRHNYRVSKINERNSAQSKLWAVESDCRSKASTLGSEVSRLVKLHFEAES